MVSPRCCARAHTHTHFHVHAHTSRPIRTTTLEPHRHRFFITLLTLAVLRWAPSKFNRVLVCFCSLQRAARVIAAGNLKRKKEKKNNAKKQKHEPMTSPGSAAITSALSEPLIENPRQNSAAAPEFKGDGSIIGEKCNTRLAKGNISYLRITRFICAFLRKAVIHHQRQRNWPHQSHFSDLFFFLPVFSSCSEATFWFSLPRRGDFSELSSLLLGFRPHPRFRGYADKPNFYCQHLALKLVTAEAPEYRYIQT